MSPPVLTSPAGTAPGWTRTYRWNDVPAATDFYLWVNDASGTPVHRKWYRAQSICTSGSCSMPVADMLQPGNYRWWVRPWNKSCGYGDWSAGKSFSVEACAPWNPCPAGMRCDKGKCV
jgi:hypothetical protein